MWRSLHALGELGQLLASIAIFVLLALIVLAPILHALGIEIPDSF